MESWFNGPENKNSTGLPVWFIQGEIFHEVPFFFYFTFEKYNPVCKF